MEVPIQSVETVSNNSNTEISEKKLRLLSDLAECEAETSLTHDEKETDFLNLVCSFRGCLRSIQF